MGMQVRESTIEEIESKLGEMATPLNKIAYLESALHESGFSFEIKRFIWNELAKLYEERKMFEKAGMAMANKAGVEVTRNDKIESYLKAAEFFTKSGRVDEADDMFIRASRDGDIEDKAKIKLARKNIFMVNAQDLKKQGKKVSAVKFYEKLIKMNLLDDEKQEIKEKLIDIYKATGRFKDAELLEGL
jgi:tetratricopeptide (TPR) repeat protein